jgi:hypothetical protein
MSSSRCASSTTRETVPCLKSRMFDRPLRHGSPQTGELVLAQDDLDHAAPAQHPNAPGRDVQRLLVDRDAATEEHAPRPGRMIPQAVPSPRRSSATFATNSGITRTADVRADLPPRVSVPAQRFRTMQVKCSKCGQFIALSDIIESSNGRLSHVDCTRPRTRRQTGIGSADILNTTVGGSSLLPSRLDGRAHPDRDPRTSLKRSSASFARIDERPGHALSGST